MDFRTAYIIRKPFAYIKFFDIFVEILTSSFELVTLKGKPIKYYFLWNNMSTCRLRDFFFFLDFVRLTPVFFLGGNFTKRSLKLWE